MSNPANSSITGRRDVRRIGRILATALIALAPGLAAAQQASTSASAPGDWRYGLTIYGFLPTLRGESSFPVDSSGQSITIDMDNLLDNLNFTAMLAFEAHNGRWGVFTDLLYIDLSSDKQGSRDFTLGGASPPVGTTADLDMEMKGAIWTLAGEYRVVAKPTTTVDVFGGARWLKMESSARWNITGSLGTVLPEGRTGSAEVSDTLADGIVGVRGRVGLGSENKWFMPFYLDVGAGESDLTWQAAAGIGYQFKWGAITTVYRHLAYEMEPGKALQDLSLSGPMIGATWRW